MLEKEKHNKKIKNIVFLLITVVAFINFSSCNQHQDKVKKQSFEYKQGAIIRGDKNKKEIALVFTGDGFADGGEYIFSILNKHNIKASFFFTGNFYSNPKFSDIIQSLVLGKHYVGAHSDKHLLYCDWSKRDSLLVTKHEFTEDLNNVYSKMKKYGISINKTKYFLPPYEWYNDSISSWTEEMGLQLINFTPGTLSNADYTIPEMKNYRSSKTIYNSIINYEKERKSGLNGFILLTHIGTHPDRTDKFYYKIDTLIKYLKHKGYMFKKINELLDNN